MEGSTLDAMSTGVDNAAVMLSCISLAYKESANCRLEAQYGHQQGVDMIPLKMEEGYIPIGWLGLLVGTRIYFTFHPDAIRTSADFMRQMDLVERDLKGRGKVSMALAQTPARDRQSSLRPAALSGPASLPSHTFASSVDSAVAEDSPSGSEAAHVTLGRMEAILLQMQQANVDGAHSALQQRQSSAWMPPPPPASPHPSSIVEGGDSPQLSEVGRRFIIRR
eukprot:COSAG01_NODE_2019_length_8634_cov_14.764499_4_plen_222_part_00